MRKVFLFTLLFFIPAASIISQTGFSVQFGSGHIEWNPHHAFSSSEAQLFTALHEGLVSYDPETLLPVPGAAQKWEISDDGKTYTFHLRDKLFWSSGTPLNANDFKESWLDALDPENNIEYASLLEMISGAAAYRNGDGNWDDVGIETPDARTLIVKLDYPAAHLLSILCHYTFVPIHSSLRKQRDWSELTGYPVNGPFIVNRRNEASIELAKNPYYWDQSEVKLETITIYQSGDAARITEDFNQYKLDWVTGSFAMNAVRIPGSLQLNSLFSTSYFYFNNENPVWQNPEIRKALILLLPLTEIRQGEMLGARTLIPPIPEYPEVKGISKGSDEEAYALLDKNGYPEGKGLPEIKMILPENLRNDVSTRKIIENWTEKLDTELITEYFPYPDYYDRLKESDYTLGTLSWTGDYADPLTFLEMWLTGSSLNDSGYANSEYDKLVIEGRARQTPERYHSFAAAEQILLDSAQIIPIDHIPAFNLIDLRFIQGWYPNALNIHPFKYIHFSSSFEPEDVI